MKKILVMLAMIVMPLVAPLVLPAAQPVFAQKTAADCTKGDFFGLVPWYGYISSFKDDCSPNLDITSNGNDVNRFNVIWLIGLAVFEDILRIAGVVAFAFVIYGGFRYITSQGEPDNTKAALSTIINALIGLGITILGAAVVSFIGAKLGG